MRLGERILNINWTGSNEAISRFTRGLFEDEFLRDPSFFRRIFGLGMRVGGVERLLVTLCHSRRCLEDFSNVIPFKVPDVKVHMPRVEVRSATLSIESFYEQLSTPIRIYLEGREDESYTYGPELEALTALSGQFHYGTVSMGLHYWEFSDPEEEYIIESLSLK